jgi:parvulin-like peptidyl-prolyl isomerase
MMEKAIDINCDDLIEYAKLSCQLPKLIEGAIVCKIIQSKAAQIGIEVTPEELQQIADSFRITKKLHQTKETQLWLEKNFLSLDDFENLIHTNAVSEKLVKHLFADRVESFFEENKLNYTEVAIYEIVLEDNDLAGDIYYSLQAGKANFHSLARRYIQEPNLRRCGGYRGIICCNQLHPEIAEAILAANPPQLLKPIVTAKGVHLIFLEEIIQPKLDDRLRDRISADLFSSWLEQQASQIEVIHSWRSETETSKVFSYS